MVTLDEVFPDGAPEVSLIKVDVEGGEADVLAGARRLIGRDSPALILEVNDAVRLDELLAGLDYSCWVYDPDGSRMAPTTVHEHVGRNVLDLRRGPGGHATGLPPAIRLEEAATP